MNRLLGISILMAVLLLADIYAWQAVRLLIQNLSGNAQKWTKMGYWSLTAISFGTIIFLSVFSFTTQQMTVRNFLITGVFAHYLAKSFIIVFLFIDDAIRLVQWGSEYVSRFFATPEDKALMEASPDGITRSEFLAKAGLAIASVPVAGITFGILSGAHDYRVRKTTVYLPNLPASFDGITIAQLSDIHSGSFFNKTAVKGGVELLMQQKPDMVFFTGDFVNYRAEEAEEYVPIFGKVKAPMGVYATLGNHDYGDYVNWDSQQQKVQNLQNLKEAHKLMGWELLMNENRIFTQGGEKLAVLGVENYGKGRFPKYGQLANAHAGTDEAAVKLLLSHDPSHWDLQIRPEYADIDIMFAGHTHGMQFGVEIPGFKWSPVQYMYPQWAGLYQEGKQYLYVNRGFGYLGFPGRVGIFPEITVMELKKA